MIDLDITFEDSPWQRTLDRLHSGDRLSALAFLPLVAEGDEDGVLDAFADMNRKKIQLDISDLPPLPAGDAQEVRLRMEQQLAAGEDLTEGLSPNDSLRLYMEELAATPCGQEEPVLLARYLAGEQEAAEGLLTLGLSLVVETARSYTGQGVLLMDLIQEGSLGLWQAITSYTEGDYQAHCLWWIRQYMAQCIFLQARAGGLCRKMQEGMEHYAAADRQLLTDLGRNPTLEEIAARMGVPPEEAETYGEMIRQARQRQQVDKALAPKEETPEDEQAVEDTAYFRQRQRITELLGTLSPEEAQLLTLRFGLEGGLPMTPDQAGEKLGLTPQEVIQKEAEALAKLRQQG